MKKRAPEIAKYDWAPDQRGRILIYKNRTRDEIDPGIDVHSTIWGKDVLLTLLARGMLIGTALLDATQIRYERDRDSESNPGVTAI